MKLNFFGILLLLFFHQVNGFAQQSDLATNEFLVCGKVKKEKSIDIHYLKKLPAQELKNINTSCSPKSENIAKSIKAVLLKDALDSVDFDYEKPKQLGQFYFLFVSKDGYSALFSFNEIFNTEVGNNLYLITEYEGKPIEQTEERIMLLSSKDIKGGSRNVKGLSKIVVGRAAQ